MFRKPLNLKNIGSPVGKLYFLSIHVLGGNLQNVLTYKAVKQLEKYPPTACHKLIAQNIVMVNAGIYAVIKLSKVIN